MDSQTGMTLTFYSLRQDYLQKSLSFIEEFFTFLSFYWRIVVSLHPD